MYVEKKYKYIYIWVDNVWNIGLYMNIFKFITTIKTMKNIITKIKNLLKAKYRIIYQKQNGDCDTYILQNPTWATGRNIPHFSNPQYREAGIYNKGFKAVCVNRDYGVRSFNYSGIRSVEKLTLLESLV
jgi:hypothetical protein